MLPASLITFRETLEAVLVVGIILTFLVKTNQHNFSKFVWRGIFVGVMISGSLAFILETFVGGLTGRVEQIFEGILMLLTAGFLTWMILWIHRQKDVAKRIKRKVTVHVQKGYGLGIFFLVTTSVFREGTETVLYLKASSLSGAENQLIGAVTGLILALILGFIVFTWATRINLSTVFNITSVLLLLFAAGLVAHGVHEFQEVGFLPIFYFDPLFNITHIVDHKSLIGSFLRTLFGYSSQPTFLEAASYGTYIFLILWIEKLTRKMISKD